jgi:hypothetical protein
MERKIEENIKKVMATSSKREDNCPPMFKDVERAMDTGEVMERAKLREYVKDLSATPHSSREACEAVGCIEYPNYGNKETCPPYYARWKIEPNTFNIINGVSTDVGNIIKYIMRHDMKDGLRDLYKARDYLNMMIEHHYGKENV